MRSISLVGLDVHAAQTHAAILNTETGELRGVKLGVAPVEVVGFLAGLPGPVQAVYEAGPTGFGLAREAKLRGVDVQVVASRVEQWGVLRARRDKSRIRPWRTTQATRPSIPVKCGGGCRSIRHLSFDQAQALDSSRRCRRRMAAGLRSAGIETTEKGGQSGS